MADHKHVELRTVTVAGLTDRGKPILAEHKVVQDVPVDEFPAFHADAVTKWQEVKVSDTCPDHCTAQLAGSE